MRLTVVHPHKYGGIWRVKGEVYEANALLGPAMVLAKLSVYTDGPPKREPLVRSRIRSNSSVTPKRKRVYKRRDMRAEN